MHKAWCCLGEVPYCFSRSSVKLQGHTAKKSLTQIGPSLPAVREKRSGKSPCKILFLKVREKSGNSVKSQGKILDMGSQWKVSEFCDECLRYFFFLSQSYIFMFLILVSLMGPDGKILSSFFMLCDIFHPVRFSREENKCARHSLLTYWGWDMIPSIFTDKFSFVLPWSKIRYYVLKNFSINFGQRNFGADNHQNLLHLCLIEEVVLLSVSSWYHTGCSQLP